MTIRQAIALAALVGAASCKTGPSIAASSTDQLTPLKVVDVGYMDTTVKACTDFSSFANGGWIKRDTIPAAYSSTGVGKDMSDRNQLTVRSVLDQAVANRASLPDSSTQKKLGTFYASCMDSTAAESAGLSPLASSLAAIDSVTDRAGLLAQVVRWHPLGASLLFSYSPSVNVHDADHYIADVDRGGLGMPDRDYYLAKGAPSDSTRTAYVTYVTKLLTLGGEDSTAAANDANRVMSLEAALATAQLSLVVRRDPKVADHPMTVAALAKIAPDIPWTAYFHDVGITQPVALVNVDEPAYLKVANGLLVSRPLGDWRAYLRFHAIAAAAPWLSSPFVNADFAFNSRFTGAKELLPRWKRCLQATDGAMGEALGQAYVDRTFPPDAKTRAAQVIHDVRAAFKTRLMHLTWMSDSTRAHALDKLARMGEKIGYPDRWRDYSALRVSDQPFVLNMMAANHFEWNRVVNRPGQPVDKSEWGITVPTVDAYYDPSKNEMVFPAGALVPQTFDPRTDDGANYGALGGSWAGHEQTHGFDDEGRHYDAAGNLRDWWTADDSKRFDVQAELYAKQFDGYIQVDTFHVNGHLTLGENIADYGGALTGYDALELALARDGRPGLIEGYTPEQRYFIAFAQTFRAHSRPEELRSRVTLDPHSPEQWRINGPLSDMPAFAQAFNCKPGDAMVRPAAAIPNIW